MTTVSGPAGAALPSALRELWRRESVGSVWRRPGDWYDPAVDALTEAVLAGHDERAAAVRLGGARGRDGVGIGESIDDLGCLYRAAAAGQPPLEVIRALCTGWSEATAADAMVGTCLDAESGLPNREYLTVRLAETYAVAAAAGPDGLQAVALVLVDSAAGELSPWARIARSAAVGAALARECTAASPAATLGGGVFAVLVARDEAFGRRLSRLRDEIRRQCERLEVARLVRIPVRVWAEPLPPTHEMAARLLLDLSRA